MAHLDPTTFRYAWFLDPILCAENVEGFLGRLHVEGLLFHLEESPDDIYDLNGGRLFSDLEAQVLTLRLAEIFKAAPDPLHLALRVGYGVTEPYNIVIAALDGAIVGMPPEAYRHLLWVLQDELERRAETLCRDPNN